MTSNVPLLRDRVPGLLERVREAHMAMIDAVLAGHGLAGVAEVASARAGGPVAIVVPARGTTVAPSGHEASGETAKFNGWAAERGGLAAPESVLAHVPIRVREEVVGVVALLRSHAAPSADAAEFLHAAAAAAITELAIAGAREAAEESMRGSFLEELLTRQALSGAEIVRRAGRLGCDLSRGAVILCVELTTDRRRLVAATIAEEYPGALAEQLDGAGGDVPPRLYAALPATGDGSASSTLALAKRLAARLGQHGLVGLSSFYSDPAELGCAAQEAELVLDVLHHSDAPIGDEIASGTYKLLLRVLASHPEELQVFYEATIAPLVRYDDQYRTDLVHTLQTYLETNCNMNATAAAIFAHRHTIAYRLERIRELTRLDPMLSEDRERLGLSLKVHRLIAPRLPR
ncbi:MAG TPA: helix-turn-helix domain-containing protein [Solirubrobacteraceae bacterium]|nr:helix-turn-helix domain-containing protein [Solirubrobacteraceae bacterium]